MSLEQEIKQDVEWRDLLTLSKADVIREFLISLPWLLASFYCYQQHWFILGLACSFMVFLTCLRQVHNAYHYTFGISRASTEWIIFAQSLIMLGSLHAVQITHLRHHRFCMEKDDVEAMSANMPAWKAFLVGPLFPIMLHQAAWKYSTKKQKKWIIAELASNVIWLWLVFGAWDFFWLKMHVLAMALGQCMTSFFAVWTVHRDCDPNHINARTLRNSIKSRITYNMFFHFEHHLFPLVPTCKLHILARRIDSAVPNDLAKKSVF